PKEKLDKKVVDIVKEAGKLYKDAKHLHADAVIVSKIEGGDEKREIKVTAVFDVEKPNHLSMKTKFDGDAAKGADVIADGKHLIIYRKGIKEYVERDLPKSMAETGLELLRLSKVNSGMLFANIVADDPGELLMDGVDSCSYAGKDKVDGTPVHRLKFK